MITRRLVVFVVACAAVTAPSAVSAAGEANGDRWSVYGLDLSNTRLNPNETKVNRKSVGRLTQTWSKDGLIGVSGTPTVYRGRAYFGDWQGNVWAVDAKTGADIWSTKIGSGGFGFVVGAPAISSDAVYISTAGTLYRLDPDLSVHKLSNVVGRADAE